MIRDDQAASAYEQHYQYALLFACRLCQDRDLAQHVVSDVFSHLVERTETITNVKGYILRSVHHRVVDYYREAKRDAPIQAALHIAEGIDFRPVEVAVEQKESHQSMTSRVFRAMRSELNRRQRRILVLRYIQGRSSAEVAEAMGLKEIHVRTIRYRAIAKLRRALEPAAENSPELPALALDTPQVERRSYPVAFIGEAFKPCPRRAENIPSRKRIEVAKAMQRFMGEYGKTLGETARFFGVSIGTVQQYKWLLSLSEEDQRRLATGKISLTQARAILRERANRIS